MLGTGNGQDDKRKSLRDNLQKLQHNNLKHRYKQAINKFQDPRKFDGLQVKSESKIKIDELQKEMEDLINSANGEDVRSQDQKQVKQAQN